MIRYLARVDFLVIVAYVVHRLKHVRVDVKTLLRSVIARHRVRKHIHKSGSFKRAPAVFERAPVQFGRKPLDFARVVVHHEFFAESGSVQNPVLIYPAYIEVKILPRIVGVGPERYILLERKQKIRVFGNFVAFIAPDNVPLARKHESERVHSLFPRHRFAIGGPFFLAEYRYVKVVRRGKRQIFHHFPTGKRYPIEEYPFLVEPR